MVNASSYPRRGWRFCEAVLYKITLACGHTMLTNRSPHNVQSFGCAKCAERKARHAARLRRG